ncbi:hypothetical protein A2671_01415 [Candidatus Kaiserbacteria bacterium RIFCSPHIGHO2_01_FULL_49_13]|uniref:CMP/dCMP-type deaminase domain-containing protein n=1 Tax=Candidatus Kaiserbacteria bacterium RIFCSPHIGHO2_01_FULL_49_13 TaxID=1798477 RepID=A0A1F6CEF5_9BACT|nr:MAG: hypothetical protein A2671_01415 [Candidatus Kaiserbacteria bacterium RIFCSPHIGHO2_01_FULL_49_13]
MPSENSVNNKALVAYVPALHAGYLALFAKHPEAHIFVLGKSFIDAYPRLNRDLRALDPPKIVTALTAFGLSASVLEIVDAAKVVAYKKVVLPDEDVSRDFAQKYLVGITPTFESIFLRWDGTLPDKQKEVTPDRTTSKEQFDQEFMRQAVAEGQRSADWWRQIGAVAVQNGKVIFAAHTRYFPSDQALDIFGTPRSNVDFGERPDLYISMHGEADIVAQAAKAGVSLVGASLYTSTFPCINCAFLIARAGISKIYYAQGYSRLDSEGVLKGAGIEIIFVDGV